MWNIILDFDGRFWCTDVARRDNTSSKSKFCSPPQLAIHQFRLNLEKRTDY